MTYAQELLKEGEIRAEVTIIENLLQEGMAWSATDRITGGNETPFQALTQRLDEMNDPWIRRVSWPTMHSERTPSVLKN
jgi:hypothetical protein